MDESKKKVEVSELTNFPKVTGNGSNLAYCCGGTFYFLGRPFGRYFFIILPVFYKRNKQISLIFFCNVPKNILKTFACQAFF